MQITRKFLRLIRLISAMLSRPAAIMLGVFLSATFPEGARAATPMIDLGTLGGTYSSAARVNGSDQVVGASTTVDGSTHAFSWTQAGGMIDLGTLGGNYSY